MTFSAHAIEKAISGTQIQCSSLLVGLRWLALYSSSHCARFLIGDSLPGLQLDADSMSPPSCPLDSKSRRSEEHTSELQSLMRISYAVFCLKKKTIHNLYEHNDT